MDVFLLIGQSNMAGRGRREDVQAIHDSRIQMFRGQQWVEALEPLHDDKPTIAGIGLAMSFAASLLRGAEKSVRIGLIPCAVGGTQLSRWLPQADLCERALDIATAALNVAGADAKLAGILWHQGEGDSGELALAETYAERFVCTANEIRKRMHAKHCPIICGTLGDFMKKKEGHSYYSTVNAQLEKIPQLLENCRCVSSAGLSDNGDHLHFDAVSLRTFGQRYADAYRSMLVKP